MPRTTGPPTIRVRRLAAELQRLRARDGRSSREVAAAAGFSHTVISRIEAADVSLPRIETVAALLDCYGTPTEDRKRILTLVHAIREGGWLKQHRDIIPAGRYDYLDLEGDAHTLRSYDIDAIPGPLRTDAYARALIAARYPDVTADVVDRLVAVHAARRRRLLERDAPPLVWSVIDESALRRMFGDREVMREQIEHVRKALHPDRVRFQILPLDDTSHPAAGPFTHLTFPGSPGQEVTFIETVTGGVWVEDSDEVAAVGQVFERLVRASTSEAETRAYLGDLLDGPQPSVKAWRSRRTAADPAARD